MKHRITVKTKRTQTKNKNRLGFFGPSGHRQHAVSDVLKTTPPNKGFQGNGKGGKTGTSDRQKRRRDKNWQHLLRGDATSDQALKG